MLVLFNNVSFEKCLDVGKIKSLKKFFDILYNDQNRILISKNFINYLEKNVANTSLFQALIIELKDSNRLVIQQTSTFNNIDDEFLEIYTNNNEAFLFPVVFENDAIVNAEIAGGVIVTQNLSKIRNRVLDNLLTKGLFTICYQDFKSDGEIASFFEELFLVPRHIKDVSIFDREVNFSYLTSLKGSIIYYYTLFKKGVHFLEKREARGELRKNLGGKLKLYSTINNRLIHERKIIIEHLIITVDNAFDNISIKEPTWEINIGYNPKKAKDWKLKCSQFYEVN